MATGNNTKKTDPISKEKSQDLTSYILVDWKKIIMATENNTKKTDPISREKLQDLISDILIDWKRTRFTFRVNSQESILHHIRMSSEEFENKYYFIKSYEFTDELEKKWICMAKNIVLNRVTPGNSPMSYACGLWDSMKDHLVTNLENPFTKISENQYKKRLLNPDQGISDKTLTHPLDDTNHLFQMQQDNLKSDKEGDVEKRIEPMSRRCLQKLIVEIIIDYRRTTCDDLSIFSTGQDTSHMKMSNEEFVCQYSFIKKFKFTDESEQRWCNMAKALLLEKEMNIHTIDANQFTLWLDMKENLEPGIEDPFEKDPVQQYEERQSSQELAKYFTKLFENGITQCNNLKLECGGATQLHNNPSAINAIPLQQEQQANIELDM